MTELSLESELKKEFNKTTLEDGWLDKTSITGKWKITIDGVSFDVPAGKVDTVPTGINYGTKTEQNVEVGDDITIGETEKFKVIKKSTDGKTITVIPYYNLKLDETPIKQATAENAGEPFTPAYPNGPGPESIGNAGTIAFSSVASPTWGTDDRINLENNQNNINNYIEAYQTTLKNFGVNNLTAKIGITRGEENAEDYVGNVPFELLNPSNVGEYWFGSWAGAYDSSAISVYGYENVPKLFYSHYSISDKYGVRPIIIITIQ